MYLRFLFISFLKKKDADCIFCLNSFLPSLFLTGQGLQILIDLIRLFSVTHVVQLTCKDTPQSHHLTPDLLKVTHGWQTHPPTPSTLTEAPASNHGVQSHLFLNIISEFEGAGTPGEM